jgi:hypothetical protein
MINPTLEAQIEASHQRMLHAVFDDVAAAAYKETRLLMRQRSPEVDAYLAKQDLPVDLSTKREMK